jgi:hypothetical protein
MIYEKHRHTTQKLVVFNQLACLGDYTTVRLKSNAPVLTISVEKNVYIRANEAEALLHG